MSVRPWFVAPAKDAPADCVAPVELETAPRKVYMARHVVGSSHNKETSGSQIEIWREAVVRAAPTWGMTMQKEQVQLLSVVCALCGNISARIVGAHVYCDMELAWETDDDTGSSKWTAHELKCSYPSSPDPKEGQVTKPRVCLCLLSQRMGIEKHFLGGSSKNYV